MEFWRRNWGYKLVSLFLAVLLWMLVSNQMRAESAQQAIPLQEKSVPGNLIVTSKLITSVTVSLQGNVNPSLVKDIVAYVDLSQGVKGENRYPVVVAAPPGIKVSSVEPANVMVTLDELKEKTFSVSLATRGRVGEGMETGTTTIRPSTVTVRGPEQMLDAIDQVFVEVNLANATDTIQATAAVRFKDAKGSPIVGPDPTRPIVVSQPTDVTVIIPVFKRDLASKTVPVRAQTKGNPGGGLIVSQVLSTPAAVRIYGPADKLKGIDFLNGGTVDVSGATQDILVEIKPENLGLPSGVSLEPGVKINVVVRFGAASVERTIKSVPIEIKNLAAGLGADLAPSSALDVKVKGAADIVNGLKESDISLWVDLTGLGAGEQTLPVLMELPPGVTASDLPQIKVTIK